MPRVQPIAFYLPQFHPLRVNDSNWEPGFTDWNNVVRAKPLFTGHQQPKLPGLLGYYDLRATEVMIEQAQLARAAGLAAFCFYYYRFGSLRVMEKPLDRYLCEPRAELPFLWCWANESWTKAWDGRSDEVLLEQSYGEESLSGLISDLSKAIIDPRYFRINDRPVFMIYQTELLPDGPSFASRLSESIRKAVGEDLLLGAVYSPRFDISMLDWLDFVVQFPPHRLPRSRRRQLVDPLDVSPFDPARGDHFEHYDAVTAAARDGADLFQPCFLGVTPDWDNSARRQSGAHVLLGSTPEKFRNWVAEVTRQTLDKAQSGVLPAPVFFVNAWNEWAEGAMLEPSLLHGSAYLDALTAGITIGEEAAATGADSTNSGHSQPESGGAPTGLRR